MKSGLDGILYRYCIAGMKDDCVKCKQAFGVEAKNKGKATLESRHS